MNGYDYDIVMPGYLFCDVIFRGIPQMPALGEEVFCDALDIRVGGAFNTVSLMHGLGLKVGLLADVGNDLFSKFILSEFQSVGVSTSLMRLHQKPMPAITSVLSFSSDRSFITYMKDHDNLEPFDADLFDKFSVRHFHLPGLKEAFSSLNLINRAIEKGITISMDCQWHPDFMDSKEVWDIINKVDIFLPNEKEALYLTKENDVEAALSIIGLKAKSTVIKLGRLGALGKDENGIYKIPTLSVDVIDTTGAGDSFNAGFLFGYLNHLPILDSIIYGNICGSLSVTVPGSGLVVPSKEQFSDFYSQLLEKSKIC
jgi:sugar/nucleoside kinase (ribokinase family)